MAAVKTAISMEEQLLRRTTRLAKQMGLSRSRLISKAVAEYIHKHSGDEIVRQLDEFYADGPPEDEADVAFRRAAAQEFFRLPGTEW